MNIVICVDHRFVMQCGILAYSTCVNNKDRVINFYIMIDDTFTDDDRKEIIKIVSQFNKDNTVEFILVDDNLVKDFLWYEKGYYTRQTFYRLLMPKLLPNNVDKVLYLDGDIIVRGSLCELWNLDINNVDIGVTVDGDSGMLSQYNRLRYSIDLGYFNAGVMLVNLKKWREENLGKDLLRFLLDNKELSNLGDQDALNYVLRNSKIHIPLKYNVQPKFLYQYQYMPFSIYQYKDELDEARVNPIILHFAGCRPWVENCPHPYKEEFLKYKAQTIWKDVPLSKVHVSIKDKMKEFLRKVLTPFGICHYVADYFDRDLKLISHNN